MRNHHEYKHLVDIGGIVATVLDRLCREVRPGVTTGWLDERAGEFLAELGAEATPAKEYDYPGRLCISVNDEVVHGIPGERVLREGDLVKLDLTADRHQYVADATRMAVIAPADDVTTRLADSARRACLAGAAVAQEGMPLTELGRVVEESVSRDGFTVVKSLCGHGVGRRIHEPPEVPNFPDLANAAILRKGMVITIEPIISAGSGRVRSLDDGWTMVTTDGAWSGHYEETVIVGDTGSEVVTALPGDHG